MGNIGKNITTLSALLMLVGGGVATTNASPYFSASGAIFVAMGSALLSLSITETRNFDRAKELLAPHLEPVCDQFLEGISQLRQATKDFRDGRVSEETAVELIGAHASSLASALRNLQAYSGASSDRERIRKSRQETKLDDEAKHDDKSNLVENVVSRSGSERVLETVVCPNCDTTNRVLLGLNVGDSGSVECTSCTVRFHVHRDRFGDPFTNLPGATVLREHDFWCPSCKKHHFKFKAAGVPRPRYCLECFARIAPVVDHGEIINKSKDPIVGVFVPEAQANGKSVVECECGLRCNTFYRNESWLFAECGKCEALVRAPVQA